jgi:hypothetical protein
MEAKILGTSPRMTKRKGRPLPPFLAAIVADAEAYRAAVPPSPTTTNGAQ